MKTYPLVSALLYVRDRLDSAILCDVAVRSFLSQTWPNRELVIAHLGDYVVNREAHDNIREIRIDQGSLGAIRQRLLYEARGDIVMRWDDDAISMPERMRVQVEPIAAGSVEATLLGCHIRYSLARNTSLVGWNVKMPGISTTICHRRDAKYSYQDTEQQAEEQFRALFKKPMVIQGDRLHILIHSGVDTPYDYLIMQDLVHKRNIWRMDTSHDRLLLQALEAYFAVEISPRGHTRVSPYILPKDKIGQRIF